MDEEFQVFLGRPKSGYYVYSCSGCGDDCAIRICESYDASPDPLVHLHLSPEQAKLIAHALLKVIDEYEKGKETGPYLNLHKDSLPFKLLKSIPK